MNTVLAQEGTLDTGDASLHTVVQGLFSKGLLLLEKGQRDVDKQKP